ncbi:hypothetical protein BC938DRAFT_473910 [Jimgerdemannia flammicorona]|uniref:Uncharacterized protein n=1 Tax=Jimgerdemannia flammicorona TaxID=994334 RepID=A0A433QSZ8_9FUNG|nr:hypothetical protein BC938DRAFT_473910 [Jimgerdemannia flammicorona]
MSAQNPPDPPTPTAAAGLTHALLNVALESKPPPKHPGSPPWKTQEEWRKSSGKSTSIEYSDPDGTAPRSKLALQSQDQLGEWDVAGLMDNPGGEWGSEDAGGGWGSEGTTAGGWGNEVAVAGGWNEGETSGAGWDDGRAATATPNSAASASTTSTHATFDALLEDLKTKKRKGRSGEVIGGGNR